MDVLYMTCEMAPYVKVGGLADVAGSLTHELARRGHRVRVLMPLFRPVRARWTELEPAEFCAADIPLGDERVPVRLHRAHLRESGVDLWLLECDRFFDRPDPYVDPVTCKPWADGPIGYALLCRAALELCLRLEWIPDVIHLNDHQTALTPLYLRESYSGGALDRTATVISIHNLGYQGIYPDPNPADGGASARALLAKIDVREALFGGTGPIEFYGKLNFMKAGIVYSDWITVVSPTYAKEIREESLGFGLHWVLRQRADRITGILNGIDDKLWDPRIDSMIPHNYGPSDYRNKTRNKERLLEVMHLPADPGPPVFAMITRLVDQKGLDLVVAIAERFLAEHEMRLVVLGTGVPAYEKALRDLAARMPDRVATVVSFDEPLAHLIEAGADFFLMPSRYEPCGLNQMYSMRYGTVPVVRATGGLKDTVTEYDSATGRGQGIVFSEYKPEALAEALERALALYARKPALRKLMTNIMRIDHSWARAAGEYERVYEQATKLRPVGARAGREG